MSRNPVIRCLIGVAVVLLPLIPAPASLGSTSPLSLAGRWGCLTQGAFGDSDASIAVHSVAQIVQMKLGASNNVLSGSVFLHDGGEACRFTITGGTYTMSGTLSGKLALQLSIPVADSDGDTNCTSFIGLPSGLSSVTENFDIVAVSAKKQLQLVASDDFFTGSGLTADQGDFVSLSGQCLTQ